MKKILLCICFVLLFAIIWRIIIAPAGASEPEADAPAESSVTTLEPAVAPITQPTPENAPYFEVHYIDVGQADAALVICDDRYMLIDGGNYKDSDLIYSY